MRCCKVCGKENPDNVDFCISCGGTLSAPMGPKPSELAKERMFQSYFRQSWREFVRSPFPFLFALCYCVAVLLRWINMGAGIAKMNEDYAALYMWDAITIQYLSGIIYIIDLLPGTLTAIAIWMIYADAWDKDDRPIRTGALKILFVLQVIYLCVLSLVSALVLVIAKGAFVLILLFAGMIIALYALMVATVRSVQNTVRYSVPDNRYVKALAIIEFIICAANFSILISGRAGDELSSIMSCVLSFLLGAVLLKYKKFMEELNCKYVQMETQTVTVPAEPEEPNIPAWKRVQMEQEKSEE